LTKSYSHNDIIRSEEDLREIIGPEFDLVQRKTINFLDNHCIDFVSKSPILFVSSSDKYGKCDVSPRGDSPGFVHVLDGKNLIIPERTGNRRIDTLRNILLNPYVGILFVIPGFEETLRINGRASITTNQELLYKMSVNNQTPLLGILVEVEECFLHCAKSFKRSKLWDPQSWLTKQNLPSASKILSDHINSKEYPNDLVSDILKESYKNLY
jgi:PPOX class probable FMN-dependent enzyme